MEPRGTTGRSRTNGRNGADPISRCVSAVRDAAEAGPKHTKEIKETCNEHFEGIEELGASVERRPYCKDRSDEREGQNENERWAVASQALRFWIKEKIRRLTVMNYTYITAFRSRNYDRAFQATPERFHPVYAKDLIEYIERLPIDGVAIVQGSSVDEDFVRIFPDAARLLADRGVKVILVSQRNPESSFFKEVRDVVAGIIYCANAKPYDLALILDDADEESFLAVCTKAESLIALKGCGKTPEEAEAHLFDRLNRLKVREALRGVGSLTLPVACSSANGASIIDRCQARLPDRSSIAWSITSRGDEYVTTLLLCRDDYREVFAMSDLFTLTHDYCELERARRSRTEAALKAYLDGSEIKDTIAQTLLPSSDRSTVGVDAHLEEAYSNIVSEIAFSEVFVLRVGDGFVVDDAGMIAAYSDLQLCPKGNEDAEFCPIPFSHLLAFVHLSEAQGVYVNEGEDSLFLSKKAIGEILANDYGYRFIARARNLLSFDLDELGGKV